MGKITQEDISLAMKEFEDLDQSGSLSAPDTKPVKPSETEKWKYFSKVVWVLTSIYAGEQNNIDNNKWEAF